MFFAIVVVGLKPELWVVSFLRWFVGWFVGSVESIQLIPKTQRLVKKNKVTCLLAQTNKQTNNQGIMYMK